MALARGIHELFITFSSFYLQDNYTIQMINEGEEPENFFWVGIGGEKTYDTVSTVDNLTSVYIPSVTKREIFT